MDKLKENMKNQLVLLFVSLLAFSCSKKNKVSYAYTFIENAALIIESQNNGYMKYWSLEEGENLVFEYEYQAEDNEHIQDDEYAEFIHFQIDPSLNEFNYSDSELESINAVFTESCFCGYPDDELKDVPPKGNISGQKLSATEWEISIDVTFYGDEKKTISEIFTRKD